MATSWQQNYQIYRKYLQSIAMMYRNRSDIRVFTELILSLVAIIVFAVFAIRPTALTITGLVKEIDQKKQTIETLDKKIADLTQAQTVFESERERLNTLNSAIPNSPQAEVYIRQMEGLAAKHNVQINAMTIGDAVMVGQPIEEELLIREEGVTPLQVDAELLEVTVSVTGNYSSLLGFLIDFENAQRPIFVDISQMSLTEGDTEEILVLSIEGRIPYTK